MDVILFLKGLAIGFSIAAPVGPIGVLCIRRTFTDGRVSGLVSGLGAATADTIYGCVAAFGVTFISSFLVREQLWLRLIGGMFLLYLGVKIFVAKPMEQNSTVIERGLFSDYTSTLALTLTNPMTIISFAAIFAGLGLVSTRGDFVSAGVLVLGVFLGSALWWVILSSGVAAVREKFNPAGLRWVNRISGAVITGLGMWAFLSAF